MKHLASQDFWDLHDALPKAVRDLAKKNFELLKSDPQHPSLHFKKVKENWSIRVGANYRALATKVDGNMRWHWIGSHADYDDKIG